MPILGIVAALATVSILGFGADDGVSKDQVREEVSDLLEGLPQNGPALGSPDAPVTLAIFIDLECPTVQMFVESYLPSLIHDWVRTGKVKLVYRSLETDTPDEQAFFRQEAAALAAGRQDKLWNFALTFIREQRQVRTDYASDEFLTGIASQVPGLKWAQWRRDRADPLLSKQVALSIYSGHNNDFRSTPSFLLGLTTGRGTRSVDRDAVQEEVESALNEDVQSLREEAFDDNPTVAFRPNIKRKSEDE